jgi:hypothetical protein
MANLVTAQELAIWTSKDIATVAADPFATMVLAKATELIVDKAEQPGWEEDPSTAKRRAKTICLLVASRTYLNPQGEIATNVGPLGARIPEAMAMAAGTMSLTEAEEAELEGMQPTTPGQTGLWVQPTTRVYKDPVETIYLADNTGSDWEIPYLDPNETDAMNPDVI